MISTTWFVLLLACLAFLDVRAGRCNARTLTGGYDPLTALEWKVPSSCTKLDVSKSKIGSVQVVYLAKALLNSPVVSFKCSFNNVGDSGAAALAEVIKENSSVLTKLELAANAISADGALLLAEALESNTHIAHLELSGNDLGDAGAAAIAEALKVNTAITLVGLHQNGITDVGATALAAALETNHKLEYIGLNKNRIGSGGAVALAAAVMLPTTAITTLKLDNNRVGDDGAIALAEVIVRASPGLKTLKLAGNQFGGKGATAITKAMQANPAVEVSSAFSTQKDEEKQPSQVPSLNMEQVGRLEAMLLASPTNFAFIKYDLADCIACKHLDGFWADLAGVLPGQLWRVSCEAEPKLCRDRDVTRPGEPVFEAWGADNRRSGVVAVERFTSENRGADGLLDFFKRKADEAQARGVGAFQKRGSGEL